MKIIYINCLIFLLCTSCAKTYVQLPVEGNARLTFLDVKKVHRLFSDGRECTEPSSKLPAAEIIIKANKLFAFKLFTNGKGRYYCMNIVSFIPKPNASYTVDQYIKEDELTCSIELLEVIEHDGQISYKPVISVMPRIGIAPFMDPNGPWCEKL